MAGAGLDAVGRVLEALPMPNEEPVTREELARRAGVEEGDVVLAMLFFAIHIASDGVEGIQTNGPYRLRRPIPVPLPREAS